MTEWKSKADYRDRKWKYQKACETDVAKTIERVKREMRQLEEQKKQVDVKVTQLPIAAKG